MKLGSWFLPEGSDAVQLLCEQARISVECVTALVSWAQGDADASARLWDTERRAGEQKRELWRALRAAFSTEIDPEDLYSLSFRLDLVLSAAHNLVRETEVSGLDAADPPSAAMAGIVRDGVVNLHQAFTVMSTDRDRATELADAARHTVRDVEHAYRDAMRAVLAYDDLRRIWAETQRYRGFVDLADRVTQVSDRVWYAVVKES